MDGFQSLLSSDNLELAKNGAELLILLYVAVWIWRRIRGTQAERLVKGLLVLSVIYLASIWLQFSIITSILQNFVPVAVLAILIIFQPEIRRGLGYLGRRRTFKLDISLTERQKNTAEQITGEVISAVRELSRTRTGALIVVEPPDSLRDYFSTATVINADVSSNLLLTIFFPRSPLHDGAVVIRQDKIIAAGVILPMTENPKLSYKYGTRHRAAIGLSETSDGLCIVVSEESGAISAASRGMLVRYNTAEDLVQPLSYFYSQDSEEKVGGPFKSILSLFSPARKESENGKKESAGQAEDEAAGAEIEPSGELPQPKGEKPDKVA